MLSHSSTQESTDASPRGATVTVVQNHAGRLTKRIELKNRKLEIDSSAVLAEGEFRTIPAAMPSALAEIVQQLSDCEALIHGAAMSGALAGPIATRDAIADGRAPAGAIARSLEHFSFPNERPGILMLDIDVKGAPSLMCPASLNDARDRLIGAVPALASAPMLAIPSASANIFRTGTDDRLRGLTGIRVYVWVERAADLHEIGVRINQRLLLNGGGFAKITGAGVIHVVSMLDTSVWSPERLDFAAGASCGTGLEQRRDSKIWNDEVHPLALTNVPALTSPEIQRVATLDAEIRGKAQPEADQQRAKWFAQREKEGRATSVSWSESGPVEYLDSEHEVRLATGAWVTVSEILRDPSRYQRVKCYDPMEPDYDGGRVVGMIYACDTTIHSKAHGGTNYVLRADVTEDFSVAAPDTPTTKRHPSKRAAIACFNKRFGYVRSLGAILHTPTPEIWELMTTKAWREYTQNEVFFSVDKWYPLAPHWLASDKRRTISTLVFEPDLALLTDVRNPAGDPEPAFNIWPGFAITASSHGSCVLFLHHLRHVVASESEEVYRWILMWLAAIVQGPARLPGTALVLKGAQGAGKDTVGEVMRAIIGPRLHATISDPEQLTGRFNAPHEGKLILQVEEGFFAGDPRNRGKLKHMVTATKISIERKNVDRYEVQNCARVLITSNEDWVVPAERGNRRFMAVDVSGQHANDLGYHGALRKQMFEEGGCARFLHHLLHEVVVDWDAIRRPLPTKALREQQVASLDPERRWFLDLLADGALPGDEDGDGVVSKDALFANYIASRGDRRATKTRLTQFLKPYGVEELRLRVGRGRMRAYQFPPLPKCRAAFGSEFAMAPEWDDQEDWATDPLGLVQMSSMVPLRRAS